MNNTNVLYDDNIENSRNRERFENEIGAAESCFAIAILKSLVSWFLADKQLWKLNLIYGKVTLNYIVLVEERFSWWHLCVNKLLRWHLTKLD